MQTDSSDLNPDQQALSRSRRSLLQEMSAQDFNQWRNQPMTRAFLQHLEDRVSYLREGASDLVEMGRLSDRAEILDHRPGVIQGRLNTLRDLIGLKHTDIQDFYAETDPQTQD